MQTPIKDSIVKNQMGFLVSKDDTKNLIAENRLQQVLVRCGSGRFTCAVQDLDHFIEIINADPKARDYVRDVSIPA
jgi:hypothetical protein